MGKGVYRNSVARGIRGRRSTTQESGVWGDHDAGGYCGRLSWIRHQRTRNYCTYYRVQSRQAMKLSESAPSDRCYSNPDFTKMNDSKSIDNM